MKSLGTGTVSHVFPRWRTDRPVDPLCLGVTPMSHGSTTNNYCLMNGDSDQGDDIPWYITLVQSTCPNEHRVVILDLRLLSGWPNGLLDQPGRGR